MITLISTVAVLGVLATYAFLGSTGKAKPFHVANVFGACVLAPINFAAGVVPQAAMNAVFGLVAARALWRDR